TRRERIIAVSDVALEHVLRERLPEEESRRPRGDVPVGQRDVAAAWHRSQRILEPLQVKAVPRQEAVLVVQAVEERILIDRRKPMNASDGEIALRIRRISRLHAGEGILELLKLVVAQRRNVLSQARGRPGKTERLQRSRRRLVGS